MSPGTRLAEFEIVRVLGTGGFGIVYLARDHVLLRDVAIKEYMPAALAGRGQGATVSLRSPGFAETFAKGLDSFLIEARLLASFDHRSLVKVHRFWRGNATAYMAMQYYPGRTLKDARLDMAAAPDAAWLGAFVQSLLGALELLHGEGVFHRDISPDNILLLGDGQPVLLDFGSARRVVANGPQSFTAHLKPQFAPLEQYADEVGGMRQGPWTDLYALGATLYFVLTGRAPTPSVVRAVRDVLPTLTSLAGSTFPGVSPRLLATIDWTLALAPHKRPQSVGSVRRALSGAIAPPPAAPRQVDAADASAPAGSPADDAAMTIAAGTVPAPGSLRASRGAYLSVATSLAFVGVAALVWGAWTIDRASAPVAPVAVVGVEPAKAQSRLASTAHALPAPLVASGADPVAMWVTPTRPQEAAIAPNATPVLAAIAAPRPADRSAQSPSAPRPSTRDRPRSVRVKSQAATLPVNAPPRPARNTCDGPAFLARALCAVQHCQSPRARASAACTERARADEARRQRM